MINTNNIAGLFEEIRHQLILAACACRNAGLEAKYQNYHLLAKGAAQLRVVLLGL